MPGQPQPPARSVPTNNRQEQAQGTGGAEGWQECPGEGVFESNRRGGSPTAHSESKGGEELERGRGPPWQVVTGSVERPAGVGTSQKRAMLPLWPLALAMVWTRALLTLLAEPTGSLVQLS